MALLQIIIVTFLPVVTQSFKDVRNNYVDTGKNNAELFTVKVTMPPVETKKADQYLCSSTSLAELGEAYILRSVTTADESLVHHVSTAICETPHHHGVWDCAETNGTSCNGNAVNFGIWDAYSVNTGQQTFPKDLSVKIGGSTNMHYFVTEVHFKNPVKRHTESTANITLTYTKQPTKYNYQAYMMMVDGFIPEHKQKGYFAEVACPWNKPNAMAFSYYMHTHHNGYMAELFLIRNRRWITLGSKFTQNRDKTEYQVMNGPVEIRTGDIVAARCFFINNNATPLQFGTTDGNEMCNIDINLGYNPEDFNHFSRSPACVTVAPKFSFCDHKKTNGICY